MSDHDPFSDWSQLINRPVYAVDGKKVGFLRSILTDYLLVKKGFIVLNKYYIPKTLAESVDRKGRIRLRITALEVRANYTYSKMKEVLTAIGYLPERKVKPSSSYERLETIRYGTTRNRAAAAIAFVSGILFIFSGYKANIAIYNSTNRSSGTIGSTWRDYSIVWSWFFCSKSSQFRQAIGHDRHRTGSIYNSDSYRSRNLVRAIMERE